MPAICSRSPTRPAASARRRSRWAWRGRGSSKGVCWQCWMRRAVEACLRAYVSLECDRGRAARSTATGTATCCREPITSPPQHLRPGSRRRRSQNQLPDGKFDRPARKHSFALVEGNSSSDLTYRSRSWKRSRLAALGRWTGAIPAAPGRRTFTSKRDPPGVGAARFRLRPSRLSRGARKTRLARPTPLEQYQLPARYRYAFLDELNKQATQTGGRRTCSCRSAWRAAQLFARHGRRLPPRHAGAIDRAPGSRCHSFLCASLPSWVTKAFGRRAQERARSRRHADYGGACAMKVIARSRWSN